MAGAGEFFDPAKGAGFVQLFRPEDCVSGFAGGSVQSPSKRNIKLFGLKADAMYRLDDQDGNCSKRAARSGIDGGRFSGCAAGALVFGCDSDSREVNRTKRISFDFFG